jgi:hypothetical protein
MTRREFVAMIDAGNDIMFECDGKAFTILGWYEDGPNIAEQKTEENEAVFKDGAELLRNYVVNGKTLDERFDQIHITFNS